MIPTGYDDIERVVSLNCLCIHSPIKSITAIPTNFGFVILP